MFTMTKISKFIQHLIKRQQIEQGAVFFVLTIMFMPVMFGALAIAVDVNIAGYEKIAIQDAVETSTQSTLAASGQPDSRQTRPTLNSLDALLWFQSLYSYNRQDKTALIVCQKSAVSGYTLTYSELFGSECGYSYKFSYSSRKNTLSVTVVEKTKYVFLQTLGFSTQTIKASSKAVLNNTYNK